MFPNDQAFSALFGPLSTPDNLATFRRVANECHILAKAQFFQAAEAAILDPTQNPRAAALLGVWKVYEHIAAIAAAVPTQEVAHE